MALLGALIYAVHFLLIHAVIWIPARGDLLLALFSFLSVITFIHLEKEPGKWYWYVANVLLFFLAIFSKETAILLPVVLFLYKILISGQKKFRMGYLVLLLSYLIIYLFFTYLRNLAVSADAKALGITALLLNLRTIPETLAKFLVPVNFSTMPSFQPTATITGLLIIAGTAAFFLLKKTWFNKTVLFAILWFLMFLLPGMVYRPEFAFYTYEYLDHRAYLPFFGFVVMVLVVFQKAAPGKMVFLAAATGILVYLGGVNLYLSRTYENPLTFSERAVQTNPGSALARFIHGNQIFNLKDTAGAFNDFTIALRVYPEFHDTRFNRAMIYFYRKKFAEAKADLDTLLQYKPDYSEKALQTRGEASLKLGDIQSAIRDYETSLQIYPGNVTAQNRLALFKDLAAKIPQEPDYVVRATKLNDQGIREAQSGNFKQALQFFQQAVAEYPQFSKAIINIGNCKDALGDRQGACVEWKKAAAMGNETAAQLVSKACK
jgi:tetratricopeptide (TPR) repeat protein